MNRLGECEAIISKITTTVDGGVRITLDLSATEVDLIKKLMDVNLKANGQVFVAFLNEKQLK